MLPFCFFTNEKSYLHFLDKIWIKVIMGDFIKYTCTFSFSILPSKCGLLSHRNNYILKLTNELSLLLLCYYCLRFRDKEKKPLSVDLLFKCDNNQGWLEQNLELHLCLPHRWQESSYVSCRPLSISRKLDSGSRAGTHPNCQAKFLPRKWVLAAFWPFLVWDWEVEYEGSVQNSVTQFPLQCPVLVTCIVIGLGHHAAAWCEARVWARDSEP